MRVRVGIIASSAMWEQILAQEGVPFARVDCGKTIHECSVLVVNRHLSEAERGFVEAYLASGGAVLGYSLYMIGVCGVTFRKERIDYLTGDREGLFNGVHLMDISFTGEICREANCLRTQDNVFAVYAGKLGGGYAVVLPFEPAEMMADTRAANKNFYSQTERLPSERVSAVGKGEIRHLLHLSLKYLHHVRNLNYAHVWYFPDGMKNIFAFRIDSEQGTRHDVDTLSHTALEYDVLMSWFLDVKSHEEWLQHFAFLQGHEIGVHCYEHKTYDSCEENIKNIAKAKHKLEQAGINPLGFSAPFGMWNPELAKAIDKFVFVYSSEFSFAYDTFPSYPSNQERTFLTLQVPIHPICIGSLRKVGYTEAQMKEYFRQTIDMKLARHEPLFFYHHPTHHCWNVVRFIFQYIEEKQIGNVTMLEFARWWEKRLKFHPGFVFEGATLQVEGQAADDSVWIRILRPDQSEALVRPSGVIHLNKLAWASPRDTCTAPSDIRRIREFDARKMLGEVFTNVSQRLSRRRPTP